MSGNVPKEIEDEYREAQEAHRAAAADVLTLIKARKRVEPAQWELEEAASTRLVIARQVLWKAIRSALGYDRASGHA